MEKESLYETVPYLNNVFTQTHPDRLSSFATLLGLNPPDIENSRILELGCGKGLNLLCQGASLPESEFIGVDLAKNHIDYANLAADKLGISNVRFHEMDLMNLSESEFGKFDYIIAHGLISWVPSSVSKKIFSLFGQMLTENGIGYMSYNTFPAWHYLRMAGEIGRLHTRDIKMPSEKVANASSFISLLAESAPDGTVYKHILQREMAAMTDLPETSAIHDKFAEINKPFYFNEFVSELEKNELRFVAEVEKYSTRFLNMPLEAVQYISSIDDIIWKEQYLDLFNGRAFRQTMFCRSEVEFDYSAESAALENLFLASSLQPVSPEPEFGNSKLESFIGLHGGVIEVDHPFTKTVISMLGEKWGGSEQCNKLFAAAREDLEKRDFVTESWTSEFETARSNLFEILLQTDLIEIHTYQPAFERSVGKKPVLNPLVRMVLEENYYVLFEYNRGMSVEEPVMRQLFLLLDGTRTIGEIESDLVSFIRSCDEVENNEAVINNLAIENDLEKFAQLGLFN